MKKLLVTGASGFLGHHILRLFPGKYEVYGLYHKSSFALNGITSLQCDITNYIEIGNAIEDIEPEVVIHTAAISDANYCQQDQELSYTVNVESTKNLAGLCCDLQVPFLFTSTDLVFDGTKGMYTEEEARNPLSIYGEQKCLAEDAVLSIYPSAKIARLPLMFGSPKASAGNYIQKFIKSLGEGHTAKLFYDEYRSVCGAKSVAEGLLFYLNSPVAPSVLHIAGKEKLSRYDFGLLVAEAFSLDTSFIERCSQKEVNMSAPRPADVSLDISRAISLGYIPMAAKDELHLIASENYL